ncbi:rRNA maturation RNase YbeY [Pedobacter alpinus]|uniref:Endoribonuclease YbeY n=1 Tax=Pedobacter alpinus TaxID=1590643 RepID=A0ABW5TUH9_9SPHI
MSSNVSIFFFSEQTTYKPKQIKALKNWVLSVINAENFQLQELNFIFCSDDYLLKINREYLKHDTYTDTITFDNSENKENVFGDVFISVDRVRENAKLFKNSLADELHRVMVHSTLHLLGYKDKSAKDKTLMTDKENEYLAIRNF